MKFGGTEKPFFATKILYLFTLPPRAGRSLISKKTDLLINPKLQTLIDVADKEITEKRETLTF